MNILIVPDKFKGTLSAREASQAIAKGWARGRSADHLDILPMSDGGDGFGEVIGQLLTARRQSVETVDAAHRPCVVDWWWESKSKTAVIESARVVGLAMLPPGQFHPFELDTFGLGAVIKAARNKGAEKCLVGIGGSATNDGGFGLARALGWVFLDSHGQTLTRWIELTRLARVLKPKLHACFRDLRVAVDVSNPLLGGRGATRVYGPQKGLPPRDFRLAESSLRALCEFSRLGRAASVTAGSGAAGGLGFGLKLFAGAKLQNGFQLFSRLSTLEQRLRRADLVITGEGAIDASTLMGKGVGEIAKRCQKHHIPCLAFAGKNGLAQRASHAFTKVFALSELAGPTETMADTARWLESMALLVAKSYRSAFSARTSQLGRSKSF